MKKNIIKNWANALEFKPNFEYNSQVSLTVPDLAYTVEQILDKFTRGVHLPLMANDAFYSDTDDIDDTDNLYIDDLTDIDEFVRNEEARDAKRRTASGDQKDKVILDSGLPKAGETDGVQISEAAGSQANGK